MVARITVNGLAELQRDLQRVENLDRIDDVRDALRRGADVAAREAKQRANTFSFAASDSIRSLARTGTGGRGRMSASIKGGGARVPWYGWADFGSRRPRQGQPRSAGPWKNSGPGPRGGRFLYPAIDAKSAEIVETLDDGIRRAMRRYDF
jgi:hypothetical protein